MKSDAKHTRKGTSASKVIVCGTITLCLFLLLSLPSCQERPIVSEPTQPSTPDLSHCTRVAIQYRPSTLEYFFPGKKLKKLLNPAETEYLKSLETIVVEDQQRLKALAHNVGLGSYSGTTTAPVAIWNTINVVCHHNDERLISFTVFGRSIRTDNENHWFDYSGSPLGDLETLTPQVWPFVLRVECARNLGGLGADLSTYSDTKRSYPETSEWIDALIGYYRILVISDGKVSDRSRQHVRRHLKCPSAGEGECHYAMNPHCEPNSPPDTVLLFETKAGWNQHGGPELFTFDNHDPKGGCVLLNNGTVKFIRTQEELHSLPWK